MADDAVTVLDALEWPSAHVVGHSLGGMIAQVLAVRHPDRVRSLTSISSTPKAGIGRLRRLTALRLICANRKDSWETASKRRGGPVTGWFVDTVLRAHPTIRQAKPRFVTSRPLLFGVDTTRRLRLDSRQQRAPVATSAPAWMRFMCQRLCCMVRVTS